MRILLIITSLLFGWSTVSGQGHEVTLNIGDSLTLGPCTGDNGKYEHIDLMKKTRWPHPNATYDTATGQGFYNWYFDGDIDTQRLGCKNRGQKFRIASIHQYKQEDGTTRTVVFGQFIDPSLVLWIEITPAVQSGEVTN